MDKPQAFTGRLDSFPRIPFANAPTPLEAMPRLGAAIGLPNLWVKRDDLTGLAAGGNKARKLEFLVADAVAKGCDHLVTTGGRQSNHARMTAAAANRAGLGCTLVFGDPDEGNRPGNLLLDEILGADLVFLGESNLKQMAEGVEREMERLRAKGHTPYAIPVGGSTPLGELGYITAMQEWAEQAQGKGIDTIVLAVGSAGTAAGVSMGLKMFAPECRLLGVSVSRSLARLGTLIADMANEIAELLEVPQRVAHGDVEVSDDYVGPGYGVPSEAGIEAVRLTARTEGLLLDPVYTGKAMSGLIGLARAGRFADSTGVCFWHTGGLPALFAFESDFTNKPSA
ncbi:MAG TPA: D-cysteine desulfhydrase family protein [Armatimonadota bacterium]|jgi:D-cysteine desulfhydrase family pyridoxal phosphate-dependent enzyme